LLINWPAWYVLAWDLGRGAARTFRVDRLEAATVVDTPFVPRPQTLLAATVEDLRATFERV
ncbi:MAG: WYL domain-containing protein, partial [Gemmatimonadota bacterium]|nr:WYL domain-containing protein [Gemmatimonadota bacterium]